MPAAAPASAILFVDGSNWYHALKKIGVRSDRLDYFKVARKLAQGREVRAIHYYVGKVAGARGVRNDKHVAGQQRFLSALRAQGVRISLGRIEKNWMRPDKNPMTETLRRLLAEERASISGRAAKELARLCGARFPYYVEKQVDTRLTADLLGMAHRDEYDAAYLLSADSDFVPAVEEAKRLGKQVFAASPGKGAQLAGAVTAFIALDQEWFSGLQLE
ncbi:MAG: NYN domain-containing protein [Gammaproteobacteria bacterium]